MRKAAHFQRNALLNQIAHSCGSSVTWIMLLALLSTSTVSGQQADYIRSHYTKYERQIPMRDGKRLFTAVYAPNDTTKPYPILLFRTPYSVSPYGASAYRSSLGPDEAFVKEGFIFVRQDVRGRFLSEGEFVNMRPHNPDKRASADVDESTDTYDTIEWLVKNVSNNNGRVGQWGVSYPGFYCSAGMIDSHPALKAVSPQACIADWFWDDMHHHGAFVLSLSFNFFSNFGRLERLTTEWPERFDHKTPDGYQFFKSLGPLSNANERYLKNEIKFWNDFTQHPNYDEFWQSRNILPHLKNIKAAVMVVGGWFDTEDLYGPLKTYAAIEKQNPGIENRLVMGPWVHGGWNRGSGAFLGTADFGFKTADYYQKNADLPFFLHHLKERKQPSPPEALVFETGANRWREFTAWPPKQRRMKSLYFGAREQLAWEAPVAAAQADLATAGAPVGAAVASGRNGDGDGRSEGSGKRGDTQHGITQHDGTQNGDAERGSVVGSTDASSDVDDDAYDEFVSDPDKPVPYTMEITSGWAKKYMTEDQRFAAWRPDVLVYQTEPLERDVTIAGPIQADLWVSTSAGDADWVVKLIDVLPGEIPNTDDGAEDLGGTQRLVRAEVFRGRFRESYERPLPFKPDQPTRVSFELLDVLHTFQRGHRMMVQVQSSWFPFIDRNPQKYVPNIFEASESDFIKATHRVYRSPEYPSRIEFGVLP
jgi:putative CocE/NonD family hydrolase